MVNGLLPCTVQAAGHTEARFAILRNQMDSCQYLVFTGQRPATNAPRLAALRRRSASLSAPVRAEFRPEANL